MSTREYNKLVRDRIPDIINLGGEMAITKVLPYEQFIRCLNEKLVEEVQEFLLSDSIEELVDIFQVVLTILDEHGISFNEFEEMRQKKAIEKGEFKKRLFLICVEK